MVAANPEQPVAQRKWDIFCDMARVAARWEKVLDSGCVLLVKVCDYLTLINGYGHVLKGNCLFLLQKIDFSIRFEKIYLKIEHNSSTAESAR